MLCGCAWGAYVKHIAENIFCIYLELLADLSLSVGIFIIVGAVLLLVGWACASDRRRTRPGSAGL